MCVPALGYHARIANVKDTLHKLHANYVLVPAEKAANNVIIVCMKYILTPQLKSCE